MKYEAILEREIRMGKDMFKMPEARCANIRRRRVAENGGEDSEDDYGEVDFCNRKTQLLDHFV